MKRAPFLEATARRTSLCGGDIISNFCGFAILKLLVSIIYSILYPRSTFDQQMKGEECLRNRRNGKVALVVLGDDAGIVAPGNTRISP